MRVAYPMRVDALDKPGGDVELMRTYIRHCGHAAQRRGLAYEGVLLTALETDLSGFDAVHLTNLDRPFDLYVQFLQARKAGKPVVLTPLHHSYREIERYERHGRGGLIGMFSGWIGYNRLETLRILVKSRRYPELRPALWRVLRRGIRRTQAEVLQGCTFVLVAADKEEEDIAGEIAELRREQVIKIRNGFQLHPEPTVALADRDIEIAVISRVESRKNQRSILKALNSVGLSATFIGPPNPNNQRYVKAFRQEIARSPSTYIPGVPPDQVASYLARAQVHVAASWFEVSSLVDINAFFLGCRVVASNCGGTRELLGEEAFYVDPGSVTHIAEKILQAVKSAGNGARNDVDRLALHLESWDQIGERLLDLYEAAAQARGSRETG